MTITPATFGPTDVVTLSVSFAPTDARYRVGADGLGPALASVLRTATTSPDLMSVPASTIETTVGLASGSHSMDLYAVDAAGAAVGSPLCSARYTYDGPIAEPTIDGPSELPRARVGQPYSASTGAFVYTPTVAGTSRITQCVIGTVGYELGDSGYPVILSDIAGDPAFALPVGLELVRDESEAKCGTLRGTPTQAGTYTLVHVHQYFVCPPPGCVVLPPLASSAKSARSALSSTNSGRSQSAMAPEGLVDVASQTYAGYRTFTLTVERETVPQFTG